MLKVQFRTNANELAARQRLRGNAVTKAMEAALVTWANEVKTEAIKLSEGTKSTAELNKYKPGLYSRARTADPVLDAIVNKQTGDFAASWKVVAISGLGYSMVTILNDSAHAGFMMGTTRMRFRGVLDAAIAKSGMNLGTFGPMAPGTMYVLNAKRKTESAYTGSSFAMDLAGVFFSIGYTYTKALTEA